MLPTFRPPQVAPHAWAQSSTMRMSLPPDDIEKSGHIDCLAGEVYRHDAPGSAGELVWNKQWVHEEGVFLDVNENRVAPRPGSLLPSAPRCWRRSAPRHLGRYSEP